MSFDKKKKNNEKMEIPIVLNVGGTKFVTSKSTINSWQDTFLTMLLKHQNQHEIFIDRDPKLFRWILYWYRLLT